jgi:hypothetical protein
VGLNLDCGSRALRGGTQWLLAAMLLTACAIHDKDDRGGGPSDPGADGGMQPQPGEDSGRPDPTPGEDSGQPDPTPGEDGGTMADAGEAQDSGTIEPGEDAGTTDAASRPPERPAGAWERRPVTVTPADRRWFAPPATSG